MVAVTEKQIQNNKEEMEDRQCPWCNAIFRLRKNKPPYKCGHCHQILIPIKQVKKLAQIKPGLICITEQHAYSLREMVEYFKQLVIAAHLPATAKRSEQLTSVYCDELLEDLNETC